MKKVIIDGNEIDPDEIIFRPCKRKRDIYGVFEYNGIIEVDGTKVDGTKYYLVKVGSFLIFIEKDKFNNDYEFIHHLT